MYQFFVSLLLVLVDVFCEQVFDRVILITADIHRGGPVTDVLSRVWLKRTVAVLWYRTCRGGC